MSQEPDPSVAYDLPPKATPAEILEFFDAPLGLTLTRMAEHWTYELEIRGRDIEMRIPGRLVDEANTENKLERHAEDKRRKLIYDYCDLAGVVALAKVAIRREVARVESGIAANFPWIKH